MDTTLRHRAACIGRGGHVVDRGLVARRWQPRWFGRLLLGIAVVLAACGGDPVPPGVPDSSIPDALPGTPEEVEEALLNTDDLGGDGSTSVRCRSTSGASRVAPKRGWSPVV